MPFLSSLTSDACDEPEWPCLLSLSMLLISTSFELCPNTMMAQTSSRIHRIGLGSCKRKRGCSQVAKECLEPQEVIRIYFSTRNTRGKENKRA